MTNKMKPNYEVSNGIIECWELTRREIDASGVVLIEPVGQYVMVHTIRGGDFLVKMDYKSMEDAVERAKAQVNA